MTDETNLPVSELKANDTVYDIVGKSVVDQNNTTHLKMWSGTKAEYEALETIDESTMYLIKDDVEPLNSQTLFDCKWLDYAVDSLCWKNANDFAWISGDIYKDAYEHLVEDVNEKSADNSDTVGSYTIWYVLADDGHKIVGLDQATAAENIYNESGVAWYYILDKDNHRFKLPRTKFAFTGYRDGVGNYVEAGLPNITGTFSPRGDTDIGSSGILNADGAFAAELSGSIRTQGNSVITGFSRASFDASRSSSIYGNSNTVQPSATQMYLYFFVGNLIVNQYEIDANGFATKHLDNLSSVGKNIANWSSNVTNCITEIPQDIKLELDNGTLTLKAGSKVYVPNGFEQDGTTPHFDVVILENDLNGYTGYTTVTPRFFMYIPNTNHVQGVSTEHCFSGTDAEMQAKTSVSDYERFYNTTTNKIYRSNNNGGWAECGNSFPLAIVNNDSSGNYTSIDQVFNGFGYIGSTIFTLPGIKGLIPDGRYSDGTLKNIEHTKNRCTTYTFTGTNDYSISTFGLERDNYRPYYEQATEPDGNGLWYDTARNFLFRKTPNDSEWVKRSAFVVGGQETDANAKIKRFYRKKVFRALDYDDKNVVAGWSMPSNKYIDLTLGASETTYTAPANGYYAIACTSTNSNALYLYRPGQNSEVRIGTMSYVPGAGVWQELYLPVKRGNIVTVIYQNLTLHYFRFVYAEGEL